MLGSERYFQRPQFDSASHIVTLFQPPSPHSKSISSLTVKNQENALLCEGEETISIQYTFVGEAAGGVDLMYLVSSDGSRNANSEKKGQIPSTFVMNSPRLCQEGKSSPRESKKWRF